MNYLKDKKNLLSYYKNNLKDVIDTRKNGLSFNYDNIDSEDDEPLENIYYSVKSENDIILTKKKTPAFIQKVLNPIYHSFYLKQKSNNNQKSSKKGKNKSVEKYKNHSKNKKNCLLKKKKSKIKLSNINTKREKNKAGATNTNKSLLDNNNVNSKTEKKEKNKKLEFNFII